MSLQSKHELVQYCGSLSSLYADWLKHLIIPAHLYRKLLIRRRRPVIHEGWTNEEGNHVA